MPYAKRHTVSYAKKKRSRKTAAVIEMPIKVIRGRHNTYPYDPVFFRHQDIKVGVILECHLRMSKGMLFRVIDIRSHLKGEASWVRHNDDVIVMQCTTDASFIREGMFKYYSGHAGWRLYEE